MKVRIGRPRVIVVINKWWECDPAMGVLLHVNARPAALGWPRLLSHPHPRPAASQPPGYAAAVPRAAFALSKIDAEVWCVSDLLDDLDVSYQSSSEKKVARLPAVFQGATPALVIAVGTAASPTTASRNGCVAVGTRAFLHDGHPAGQPQNPVSQWHAGPFGRILESRVAQGDFDRLVQTMGAMTSPVAEVMLSPPLNPAPALDVQYRYDGVALGSINVTDPSEYAAQDRATLDAYAAAAPCGTNAALSLETTHGLIRVIFDAPFLFVSGIVNRVGYAGSEMLPRNYAQNFAGAHNAGVVLARLLVAFDQVQP